MDKKEYSEKFDVTVERKTTISIAGYVNSTKNDDSVSSLDALNRVSGGQSIGFSCPILFDADYVQANKESISEQVDKLQYTIWGLIDYYRSRLDAGAKRECAKLLNLTKAMQIARESFKDQSDDLDNYWNIKANGFKAAQKIRTRIRIGGQGDHIHVKGKTGELINKRVINQPGTGLTTMNPSDLADFQTRANKIQSTYDSTLSHMEDWSNDNSFKLLETLASLNDGVQGQDGKLTYPLWVPKTTITRNYDIESIKSYLKEIGTFLSKDVGEILKQISL